MRAKANARGKSALRAGLLGSRARAFIATAGGGCARVLIVGRPNTGKSTLFNRLVRGKCSPMTASAGMTQDWVEGEFMLEGRASERDVEHSADGCKASRKVSCMVSLVDTAGAELELDTHRKSFSGIGCSATNATGLVTDLAWDKTQELISSAAVVLFVLDARTDLTSVELDLARILRDRNVIVVANKSEGLEHVPESCLRLGFSNLLLVSALHGQGIASLKSLLLQILSLQEHDSSMEQSTVKSTAQSSADPLDFSTSSTAAASSSKFSMALLGKPNSGKSTIMNRLLQESRVLVSAESGTTRNAVSALWRNGDQCAHIVDTAGLRKKSAVASKGSSIEQASARDSLRALRVASVASLVIDASELDFEERSGLFAKQELTVARRVLARGKPLILLINKWDKLQPQQRKAFKLQLDEQLRVLFPNFQGLPVITLSALYDDDFSVIFKTAERLHMLSTRRESTSRVNAWLAFAQRQQAAALYRTRSVVLRYACQVSAAPPRFVVHSNAPLAGSYLRYLLGSLRRYFDWRGVPIVIGVQIREDRRKSNARRQLSPKKYEREKIALRKSTKEKRESSKRARKR